MMAVVDAHMARVRLPPWLRYGLAGVSFLVGALALVCVDGLVLPRLLARQQVPPVVVSDDSHKPGPEPQPTVRERLPTPAAEAPALPQASAVAEPMPVFRHLLFARSSRWLSPTSHAALAEVAAALTANASWRVSLGGHTDASGSEYLNKTLSLARARQCQSWLLEHGIASERIDVRGFGSSRPIDRGSSPAAHARNRRVEIDLH